MSSAKPGQVYLVPTHPDQPVPYPNSRKRLPPEGAWVVLDGYWRRRLAAGEAEKRKGPPHKSSAKKSS